LSKKRNIFKRALRAAAITTAKVALRPREALLPPREEIRKVLVIKLWAIGEYLMATPAFAALRQLFPLAEVALLTGVAAAPLAAAAPAFDRVWTVPEELFVKKRVGKLRRLRKRLTREKFDLAVVFHHAWEFSAFAAWTGIPNRVGFDRDGDGFAHTVKVPRLERRHQVEEYFDLARACGASGDPGSLTVVPGEEAEAEAEHFSREPPFADSAPVLVAPGGGVNPKTRMEAKRWPAERYVELVDILKSDHNVVLVGGPSDAALNADVAAATGVADLTGKTSLSALYLLFKKAKAFIGNDSAPMHLAAAAATPTVAFFGPTDPKVNGPWYTPALILTYETVCHPCYEDGYFPDCDHRRCLTAITASDAASRFYDFLDSLDAGC
jgi:lipopolysaccharide heptosyltransferase II